MCTNVEINNEKLFKMTTWFNFCFIILTVLISKMKQDQRYSDPKACNGQKIIGGGIFGTLTNILVNF